MEEVMSLVEPLTFRECFMEWKCVERCAEFGDPPCSRVEPGNGWCAECVEFADEALSALDYAEAVTGSRTPAPE